MALVGKVLDMPPRIKVLEALGSIADGRVGLVSGKEAVVGSSMGDREYRVYVDPERGEAYSNDNGTKFRGYIGYPIIAVLMLRGVLPYDERIAKAFAGLPWKELNERYKRYAVVEEIVKREASKKGVRREEVDHFIESVLRELAKLRLRYVEPPQGVGSIL
ncbi:MAG: hypothetical protein QXF69_03035 [Thermofilaceae archaeon]